MRRTIIFSSVLFVIICSSTMVTTQPKKLIQKTIYVPAYSTIFHSNLKWEYNLTITLSIHNIDLKKRIFISSIDYYNSNGKLIQKYLRRKHLKLKPLETYTLGIKETDTRVGVGGNFIVKWHSFSKVNSPVIETIMIGARGKQGISFTSRGVTILER